MSLCCSLIQISCNCCYFCYFFETVNVNKARVIFSLTVKAQNTNVDKYSELLKVIDVCTEMAFTYIRFRVLQREDTFVLVVITVKFVNANIELLHIQLQRWHWHLYCIISVFASILFLFISVFVSTFFPILSFSAVSPPLKVGRVTFSIFHLAKQQTSKRHIQRVLDEKYTMHTRRSLTH